MTWNAKNFNILRKQLGLTQHQAADWLEVSQKSICNWESGTSAPREDKKAEIAQKIADRTDMVTSLGVTGVEASTVSSELKLLPIFRSASKVVVIEFISTHQEAYRYETQGLVEYIADHLESIQAIQVFECKSSIERSGWSQSRGCDE